MKRLIFPLVLFLFFSGCVACRKKSEKVKYKELVKKIPEISSDIKVKPPEQKTEIEKEKKDIEKKVEKKEKKEKEKEKEKETIIVKKEKDFKKPAKKVGSKIKKEKKKKKKKEIFSLWKGECLVYQAKWNFVKIGKGLIACQEEEINSAKVYHLIGITVPEGVFANLGYGYYRVDSYIDKKTMRPYYFYSYVRNGKVERITEVKFEKGKFVWEARKYKKGVLYSRKKGNVICKNPVYDSISAFYLMRSFDFEKEDEFTIKIGIKKIWDLIIKVVDKREENISDYGVKEVYIIEPKAKSNDGFFKKGKMKIWITADEDKIPVYFLGKAKVGSGSLSLISKITLNPGTPLNTQTIAWVLSSVKR